MTLGTPALKTSRSLSDMLAFRRYVVVGANSGGDQVKDFLEEHGKSVAAFTDLNADLCGVKRAGVDVMAPASLNRFVDNDTAFVIGTIRQRDAAELLVDSVGASPERIFPFVNPMFAPHYNAAIWDQLAPRLAAVRARLSDANSRAYFDGVTAFYRTLDARHLVPSHERIGQYGYKAPGANPRPGDTIVDCGAFTGDTIEEYLAAAGGKCRVFALEAFLPNLRHLVARIEANNLKSVVTPLHVAVAGQQGAMIIAGDDTNPDATATTVLKNEGYRDLVLTETLDNIFLKHIPSRIDYLKVDVEGADVDALKGAARILREHRPVAAVAAYHKPEHVAEIPELLAEALSPCRIYAAHDPKWNFHIHYIAVPEERAAASSH